MGALSAYFLYGLFLFIGILPFPVMYGLSGALAWIVRSVIGYRKGITRSNLEVIDFPDEGARNRAIYKIYRNLADITLEGIRGFTISKKEILKRHRILNPELLLPYFESGKSMICVTGHYNNWEWGALSAGMQTPFHIVGFYKPLKNKYMDRFFRKSRGRTGTEMASIKQTAVTFQKNFGKPTIYLMAADQSPRKKSNAIWVDFLGRETAFLHGPEKYSRFYDYPVFYVDIKRVRRGYYTMWLTILADVPSALPEGEVTRRFAQKLESVIRETPENWLWSHKRWKLVR